MVVQTASHATSNAKPPRRRWSGLILRATVTVSVFAFLLSRIDLASSLESARHARLGWILLALAACSIGFIVSTFKWSVLLAGLGIPCSRWFLLRVYGIGHFTSSFLPGTIGGDVVRLRLVGHSTGDYLRTAAGILAERITGVIVMILMAVSAVAVSYATVGTPPVLILVGSSLGLLLAGLSVVLNRRLATVLAYRARRWKIRRIASKIYRLHRILRTFPRRPLGTALALSVLFYSANGFVLYLCCVAFDLPVSPIRAITVVVLVNVLVLIPISLGGLGLKQAGDVYLLGLMGVDPAQALAVALLRQLIIYGYTLIGGLFLITWHHAGKNDPAADGPIPLPIDPDNRAAPDPGSGGAEAPR